MSHAGARVSRLAANEPPYLCSDRAPWVACAERGRPGCVGWRSSRVPGGDPGLISVAEFQQAGRPVVRDSRDGYPPAPDRARSVPLRLPETSSEGLILPTNLKIYRRVAKDAKGRKVEWVIEKKSCLAPRPFATFCGRHLTVTQRSTPQRSAGSGA